MSKRKASSPLEPGHSSKRPRTECDHLSALSDELLLRVLTYLPPSTISICQRISQKFKKVAGDDQLWKSAYYDRFVRPRLRRTSRIQNNDTNAFGRGLITPAWSRRLNEAAFARTLKHGEDVDWKKQYKIRHNWSRGSCDISEIPLSTEPPTPPTLARLYDSVIYTVDADTGLRAFSYRKEQRLLAHSKLKAQSSEAPIQPTSLAVDAHPTSGQDTILVVGFRDGSFSVFRYRTAVASFQRLYSHPASCNGAVIALAFAWPYTLTMSTSQILSLYRFDEESMKLDRLCDPHLLSSLRSQTAWPPLSLSLRLKQPQIIASVAYSLPTFTGGWSVGVQELVLAEDGDVLSSRLTSAVGQGFIPLSQKPSRSGTSTPDTESPKEHSAIYSKPTSLSYAHPYLLVSHSDNTLSLYMVTSNDSALSISNGTRLHGHTSSVFGAHVERRGKAVSVSARGNEVRVWELEGLSRRCTSSSDQEVSVRLTPEKKRSATDVGMLAEALSRRGNGLGLARDISSDDIGVTRGWVGFDEENVVVLREGGRGSQALTVYDFT